MTIDRTDSCAPLRQQLNVAVCEKIYQCYEQSSWFLEFLSLMHTCTKLFGRSLDQLQNDQLSDVSMNTTWHHKTQWTSTRTCVALHTSRGPLLLQSLAAPELAMHWATPDVSWSPYLERLDWNCLQLPVRKRWHRLSLNMYYKRISSHTLQIKPGTVVLAGFRDTEKESQLPWER